MDQYLSLVQELSGVCPTLELREHEPMSGHTTFRIGGPARLMALPRTEEEAVAAVRCAHGLGIAPFYMGNGSDLLVSDQGYEGFVIKSVDGMGSMEVRGNSITAGSGVLLARLAAFAQRHSLTGLEFAHGIPGSLGGGITMSAGAYNGDMSMVVREVHCLTETGEMERVSGSALDFSYRHSAFSDERRFILGATLELAPGDPQAIKALMEELGHRRRHKQPLDLPSAGSTFKRPAGYYASALIDECKLKGTQVGGAQVSTKHAGFVVNTGGATCRDVLDLVAQVRQTVHQETGVELELEIRTLGI